MQMKLEKTIGFVLSFIWMLVTLQHLHAEPLKANEAALKAAFTIKFLNYVDFPESRNVHRICVLGNSGIRDSFDKYNGRQLRGAVIEIIQVDSVARSLDCQILFVPADAIDLWTSDSARIALVPILVVGEEGILEKGGMAQLEPRDKSLGFSIHLERAKRSGLFVQSKLLRLANEVIED